MCLNEFCLQMAAQNCKRGLCGRCCSDEYCTAHKRSYRKRHKDRKSAESVDTTTTRSDIPHTLYIETDMPEQRAIHDSILSLRQHRAESESRAEFENIVHHEFEDFQRQLEEEVFEKVIDSFSLQK